MDKELAEIIKWGLSLATFTGLVIAIVRQIWPKITPPADGISASNYTSLQTSIDAVAQTQRDMIQSHDDHEKERERSWVTTQKLFQELKDLLKETGTESEKQRIEILHKIAIIETEIANALKYRIE